MVPDPAVISPTAISVPAVKYLLVVIVVLLLVILLRTRGPRR